MDAAAAVTLYVARRDSYARFLACADAESVVVHHRQGGRFTGADGRPDDAAAVTAVDDAYVATRAAYTVIDLEGVGPVKEGRAVVEALMSMHQAPGNPDWQAFKSARESFLAAATYHLKSLVPDA